VKSIYDSFDVHTYSIGLFTVEAVKLVDKWNLEQGQACGLIEYILS